MKTYRSHNMTILLGPLAAWLEKTPIISNESCINENINVY